VRAAATKAASQSLATVAVYVVATAAACGGGSSPPSTDGGDGAAIGRDSSANPSLDASAGSDAPGATDSTAPDTAVSIDGTITDSAGDSAATVDATPVSAIDAPQGPDASAPGGRDGGTEGGAPGTSDASTDGNSEDSAARVTVSGAVQKGPFVRGSAITVQQLDSTLAPTGQTFQVTTDDDVGDFTIPVNVSSQYVEIIATGYYFDELANQLSSAPLTLRALADLTSSDTVDVNLLTSMSEPLIMNLVGSGTSFAQAATQAQSDVLSALGFSASSLGASFSSVALTGPGDANGEALAASLIVEQYAASLASADRSSEVAELSQLMGQIGAATVDSGGDATLAALNAALCPTISSIDPATVRSNLTAYYASLGGSVTVPPFEQFLCGCGIMCAGADGGTTCVNQMIDPNNCGGCGNVCTATGQSCQSGTCACPASEVVCSGTCIDESTDSNNCGGCGDGCPATATCAAGACVCPNGDSISNGTCCPVGEMACGGVCVNEQTDIGNCGACGFQCSTPGQTCQNGTCACPGGSVICGNACVDTSVDPSNCNGCGNACPSSWACSAGTCTQTSNWTSFGLNGCTGAGIAGGVAYFAGWNPGFGGTTVSGNDYLSPTPIPTSSSIAQLAVGGCTACALDQQGNATCWGYAAPAPSGTFVQVHPGRTVSCALDSSGNAYCWGSNASGGLGTGSDAGALTYGQVLGGPYRTITGGQDFACALDMSGAAFCWGNDNEGQIGNGTLPDGGVNPNAYFVVLSPTPVAGGHTYTTISANVFNACAVATDGTGYCWGSDENYGVLGTGAVGDHYVPTRVAMPNGVSLQDIEDGTEAACGLTTTGSVYCWGSNRYGALGQGSEDDGGVAAYPTPMLVPGLPPIASITADSFSACAVSSTGARYCWGFNGAGQLGDGTTSNRLSAELIP
jgi:hypothetical protein